MQASSPQKTILITGASSGIGRATAELFLQDGWRVGLFARSADKLAEIAGSNDAALALQGDVTDLSQVDGAVKTIASQWDRLDAVFNNAGIFTPQGTIDQIDADDWHNSVAVNLTGMFNTARAAFTQMRAQDPQGGRIINNGSISAHTPREGSICYTTTKHGVTGLTKSLSLDGRRFSIATSQIDIGNAKTEMVDRLNARLQADGKPQVDTMDVSDAAQAVLNMANLPLSANTLFQTIMATNMPYVGRG